MVSLLAATYILNRSKPEVKSAKIPHHNCLPKGRICGAPHEKGLVCAQKCSRGGIWWSGSCKGGVGHAGMGWVGAIYCHVILPGNSVNR